jgi:hypothetical protein
MVELDTTSITVCEHESPSKCSTCSEHKVIIFLKGRGAENNLGAHGATELVGCLVPVRVGPIVVHVTIVVNLNGYDSPCHVAGVC